MYKLSFRGYAPSFQFYLVRLIVLRGIRVSVDVHISILPSTINSANLQAVRPMPK